MADFVFTTTQASNDFVFDSSNNTFDNLVFNGGTYSTDIFIQAELDGKVSKAGDTMTGSLAVNCDPTTAATLRLGSSVNSGVISAPKSLVINIDSDNNQTDRTFTICNNAETTASNELFRINEAGLIGIGTTAPTHTLTLPSTATGIALYNTADQTTNYERVRQYWATNVYTILSEASGSGTNRQLRLQTNGASGSTASFTLDRVASPFATITHSLTGITNVTVFKVTGDTNAASTIYTSASVAPTISQSGTAGYTALLINPSESSVGSGAKLLIDAQVGGVSKFSVDNTGKITTALSQTYTATNVTTDRSYDANATTLDEVADVLGTLIADLRAVGVVK